MREKISRSDGTFLTSKEKQMKKMSIFRIRHRNYQRIKTYFQNWKIVLKCSILRGEGHEELIN